MHVHGRSDGSVEVASNLRDVVPTPGGPLFEHYGVSESGHDLRTFDPDDPDVTRAAAEYAATVQVIVDERNAELQLAAEQRHDALVDGALRAERQARRAADAEELATLLRGALAGWSPTA